MSQAEIQLFFDELSLLEGIFVHLPHCADQCTCIFPEFALYVNGTFEPLT